MAVAEANGGGGAAGEETGRGIAVGGVSAGAWGVGGWGGAGGWWRPANSRRPG